jgi:aminoglycoside/choline kinase family phosphotransferase
MDAPPIQEPISPFISIGKALENIGVHTPKIYAVDEPNGFLLLEDFGDQVFFKAISPEIVDNLYQAAINVLIKIQQNKIQAPHLEVFDKPYMLEQMQLFQSWFLDKYLGLRLSEKESLLIKHTFSWLADEISKQPYVFTHCDYHSRNLMLVSDNSEIDLGIIDFQDAMHGPFCYDLVSLLKDCYIKWPREKVLVWLDYFYINMPENYGWSKAEFVRGFDLCGLQRHLKVAGIFSRLHLRDNKSGYLQDLPMVINYLSSALTSYDEMQPFCQFMTDKVYPRFNKIHAL